MTRSLLALDRVLVLVVGLALLAGGLLALDWRYQVVFSSYADTLSTSRTEDVMTSAWWPWAFAAGALVFGLLALWWLLAHLRRQGPTTVRTSQSNETGRIEVDVRSLASAAAARLGDTAPVVNPKGTTKVHGSTTLLEIRGQVDPAADATALTEAVDACAREVAAAMPDERVECRVILDAPQRTRRRRADRVRVQ